MNIPISRFPPSQNAIASNANAKPWYIVARMNDAGKCRDSQRQKKLAETIFDAAKKGKKVRAITRVPRPVQHPKGM
jgi:uncharacterized membrane-anchored protein